MVTTITSNTFIADSVLYIRDYLVTSVTDPILSTRSNTSRFIMTSYPRRATEYPIITVRDSGGSLIQRGGMRSTVTINKIQIEIRVWGRNVIERDQLSQEILDDLRTVQTTANTGSEVVGLHDFNVASVVNVPPPQEGEENIQSKIIRIEYMVILT